MNAFFASLKAKLQTFWAKHVQKTAGGILAACATSDFVTWLVSAEHDITSFIGTHWYAAIRSFLAGLVVVRAVQAKSAPPPAPGTIPGTPPLP